MTPDLFSWRPETLRDAGMTQASEAQESKDPGWRVRAYAAIHLVAAAQDSVHVDDIRAVFREPPLHPNAWGAVWMRAIRAGIISHSGRVRPCRSDPRKHAHQYPVYDSLVYSR